MNNELLRKRTIFLKKDEKGVSGMRDLVKEVFGKELEQGCAEAEARGRIAAIVENVRNMMDGLKWTSQAVMDAMKIPLADRPAILAAL